MRTRWTSAAAASGLLLWAAPGLAEPDFGYVYTTEIEQPGETELSLWVTRRSGKSEGHYDAQDYRVEAERGLSDRAQLSLYADLAGHHVRGLGGEFARVDQDLRFQGLSAELKYRLRAPEHGRLGLALYAEPEWSRLGKVTGEKGAEYELELKAIVQKNFLADRLVWATNLTLEPEWETGRQQLESGLVTRTSEKELAVEALTGIAYHVAAHWWVGAEGRYHSLYPAWTHHLHRENYAVYAGPTIQYDAGKWGVTATWLPQLFGAPGSNGSSLELEDHEKTELRVKLSYEL